MVSVACMVDRRERAKVESMHGMVWPHGSSLTVRLEEMRVKRSDSEQWMHHRLLPQELRERIRSYDQ
ncbi:hypothetical protein QYE76_063471 [Lolium multiflorum]|uniref:Uncharacterized protein n=1 Tax=Lolium multiflorum TaxID=4521 RepID=A0AAD8S4M1_LOLMU|nr:hypothetical protein QYE76_063471 [Lolium multiflorum]